MSAFTPYPVPPVGTRTTAALVHGAVNDVTVPVYPPSPQGEALRTARKAAGVGLREAARRAGITATELSGLEGGRLTLASGEAWTRLHGLVNGGSDE